MNTDLKKPAAAGITARRRAMDKYMARHKTFCVTLGIEEDADILAWLAKQENRSAAVRKVLREVAAGA